MLFYKINGFSSKLSKQLFETENDDSWRPYFLFAYISLILWAFSGFGQVHDIFTEMQTTNHAKWCCVQYWTLSMYVHIPIDREEREKNTVTTETMQLTWFILTTVNGLTWCVCKRQTSKDGQFVCWSVIKHGVHKFFEIVCETRWRGNFSISQMCNYVFSI